MTHLLPHQAEFTAVGVEAIRGEGKDRERATRLRIAELEGILVRVRSIGAARIAEGCAISQAATSMLTEMIEGKTLEACKQFNKQDILDALGIELGPVRLKCALLCLKVLKAGAYGIKEWPT